MLVPADCSADAGSRVVDVVPGLVPDFGVVTAGQSLAESSSLPNQYSRLLSAGSLSLATCRIFSM